MGAAGLGGNGAAGQAGAAGQVVNNGNTGGSCVCGNPQGGSGGNGGNGGNGGRGQDGANGSTSQIVINGAVSAGSSVPNPTTVNVQYNSSKGCINSVITLTKTAGSWVLGTGLDYVKNLNSATTNYTNSSSPVEVYTTSGGAFDITANGGLYEDYLRVVNNTRPVPAISLSQPAICTSGSVSASFSETGWTPTNVDYLWQVYSGTQDTGTPVFTSNVTNPTFGPFNTSGTYLVKFQVREQCCGWSIPVYKTLTVNAQPSAPTDIVFSSPASGNEICAGSVITATGATGATGGVAPYTFAWDYQNSNHAYGTTTPAPPSFNSTLGVNNVQVFIAANPALGCQQSPNYTETVTGKAIPVGTSSTSYACSGENFSIPLNTSNSVAGTVFTLVGTSTNFNLTGSASLSGTSISGSYVNNTGSNQPITYTIQPNGPAPTSCLGANFTVTAIIYPKLNVSISPSAVVCPASTLSLTASGLNSPGPYIYNWTGPDGFSSAVQNPSIPNVSSANTGTYTVTVTDNNACDQTASTTMTVQDITPPSVTCKSAIIYLNASGTATLAVADVENTSSDNCSIVSRTLSKSSFDCSNRGNNSVTLTVTDVGGNTASCNASVSVLDNINPVALCQNITVDLDGSSGGSYTLTAAQVDNGSTDNCGIVSRTLSRTSFTCLDVGPNNVVLTVKDASNNQHTCSATVTVRDADIPNVAPVARCRPAITVPLDPDGTVTVTSAMLDDGSYDNCGFVSLVVSPNYFTCSSITPPGTAHGVTMTGTDIGGNTSSCTSSVRIIDETPPTTVCKNIIVQLINGTASITPADVDNNSSDACGISAYGVTPNSFDCSNVGNNSVTLTVTDNYTNSSSCNAIVTVEDKQAPQALCKNITVYLDASGNAGITAANIDNGSNDACGIASLSAGTTAFTCSNTGDNTVVLTVEDNNGNIATCNATVTVIDNIAPVITCPASVTVSNTAGLCTGVSTWTPPTVSGGGSTTTNYITYSEYFELGQVPTTQALNWCSYRSTLASGLNYTTLTIKGSNDAVGRTCTDPFIVSQIADALRDGIPGNWTCDGSEWAVGDLSSCGGDPSPCGAAGISLYIDDEGWGDPCECTYFGPGYNIRPEIGLMDLWGGVNSDICGGGNDQTMTVEFAHTVTTGGGGGGGASDNCPATVTQIAGLGSGAAYPLGGTTNTFKVTDASGNFATCSFTVTVEDTEDPVITCPANISVNTDPGQCNAVVNYTVTGSDNCTVASLVKTSGLASGSQFPVSTSSIDYEVTDQSGNSATCTFSVTVTDDEDPAPVCQNVTVMLDASGNGSTDENAVGSASTDNCGVASLSLNQTGFTCAHVGTQTVTLTVVDVHGNSSNCTATVTVIDAVNPVAICKNATVQLNDAGNGVITSGEIDNGSSDACGIGGLSVFPNTFACANVGANTVTLTVTDVNGNSSTCTATVTVEDKVAPVANCQNVTVQLNAAGSGNTTAALMNNGSTDACGIASMTLDNSSFGCANVGSGNSVILTVTDVNGNSSTCTATVTVEDKVAPAQVCQNVTVSLDATGNGSTTAGAVNNGSSDACGVANLGLSQENFACANVGDNLVTLTVTDVNGNSSTCDAIVTVVDHIAPVTLCQNVTVLLDADGQGSVAASAVNNGSADACGIASISLSQTAFTCADLGDRMVTLTVEDVNGNINSCTATVTTIDQVAPIAVCQDVVVELDSMGYGNTSVLQVNNGSTDACGLLPQCPPTPGHSFCLSGLVLSKTNFNCSEVGPNMVLMTVTDVSGNVTVCSSTVTVFDHIAPVAVCQDLVVQLDETGNGSISVSDVNNGSWDNCGIESMTINDSLFTCGDVGNNTVTMTVTDVNDNVTLCTSTITVEDNVDPVAVCQDVTVMLDASGNGSTTAALVDNGSNDACGIASISLSQTSFVCSEVGPNSETLTVTDVNGNVSTCGTTVTVIDDVDPVALCQPVTVTLVNGTYTVTASQVDGGSSDACGIASLSVDPNTFSCANIGDNPVTLTVTDVNGNVSSCATVVTVVGSIPSVTITGSTLPYFCQGQQYILTANPTAHATGNQPGGASTAVTYAWTTGSNTQSIDVYASGSYGVTITNIYGCTASASIPVVYTPTTQLSSYTLLATKHVKLKEHSVVNQGGVGVNYLNGSGKVDIQKYSMVTAPGTFVKSPKINVDATSAATNQTLAPAGVTLPPFYTYPTSTLANSAPSVTVKKNTTVTLTGMYYKEVKIEENATAIFTQPTVVIKRLDIKKSKATIQFTGCTNIILKEGLHFEDYTVFNPTMQFVTIYSSKEVHIDKGSEVIANIYADKHIKTHTGKKGSEVINMYGQYIADHIHSDEWTNWNYGPNCGTCTPSVPPVTPPTTDDHDDDGDCNDDGNFTETVPVTPPASSFSSTTTGSSLRISSAPNPFSEFADITFTSEVDDDVRLSVMDPAGTEVDMLYKGPVKANTEYRFRFNANDNQSSGVFFYRISTGDGRTQVGKMILAK